ncbi:MAG: MBL fold metallo-hydrolase, partial [Ilumatobacter sp.]|nr:MBL fold metallo-hydrolase [Ilumatobacter sp.]
DADLGGGLRLLSTPGHTPGHVSLEVTTGAERFVVSGDLMHHQLQAANPSLAEVGDTDAPRARETRRAFMDDCCGTGALVAGTHFPVAPVGRFEVDGPAAWRFRSVAADA